MKDSVDKGVIVCMLSVGGTFVCVCKLSLLVHWGGGVWTTVLLLWCSNCSAKVSVVAFDLK